MTPQQQQLEWRFDAETDRPEWAAVKTGMFGSHLSFVPFTGGQLGRRAGPCGL